MKIIIKRILKRIGLVNDVGKVRIDRIIKICLIFLSVELYLFFAAQNAPEDRSLIVLAAYPLSNSFIIALILPIILSSFMNLKNSFIEGGFYTIIFPILAFNNTPLREDFEDPNFIFFKVCLVLIFFLSGMLTKILYEFKKT